MSCRGAHQRPNGNPFLANLLAHSSLLACMWSEYCFLSQLKSFPHDDRHRLIYADWLEENGDARAQFVRLEIVFQVNCQADNASRLADQLAKIAAEVSQPSWQRLIVADRAAQVFLHFRQGKWAKSKKRRRRQRRSSS